MVCLSVFVCPVGAGWSEVLLHGAAPGTLLFASPATSHAPNGTVIWLMSTIGTQIGTLLVSNIQNGISCPMLDSWHDGFWAESGFERPGTTIRSRSPSGARNHAKFSSCFWQLGRSARASIASSWWVLGHTCRCCFSTHPSFYGDLQDSSKLKSYAHPLSKGWRYPLLVGYTYGS